MCELGTMSGEDEFRSRPGRIRSTSAHRARPFIAQALAVHSAQSRLLDDLDPELKQRLRALAMQKLILERDK